MNTRVFYAKSFFAIYFLILVLGLSASAYSSLQLGYKITPIIGLIIFVIMPIVFMKNMMRLFKKDVKIDFDRENLSVSFFKLGNDKLLKKVHIDYADIASISISKRNNHFSNFILRLKNNKSIKFIFENESSEKTEIDSDSEMLLSKIVTIARTQSRDIVIKPTFIASKTGLLSIIFLGACFLSVSIYFLFGSPKIVPYSFLISVGMFLQILGSRIKQRKFYSLLKAKYLIEKC